MRTPPRLPVWLAAVSLAAACVRATAYTGPDVVDAAIVRDDGPVVDATPTDGVAIADDSADAPQRLGPPYPIVLHHGFAGFRDIGPLNYFFNVARDLRARGEVVYESEVSPFNPPSQRATELARFVDRVLVETGRARVVVVGHSQGGIDPRQMISQLGYGDRVALLATIAAPHRGTRVADAILGGIPGVPDALLNGVAALIGFAYNEIRTNPNLRAAIEGLTERAATEFNARNRDDPRVVYWSWTGRTNLRTGIFQCGGSVVANEPARVDATLLLLEPFALFLEQGDPTQHVNDGLVEVASARWGTFMGCVPADHMDEVGQIAHVGPVLGSGFDHIAFYRDVVRRIREAGF